MKKLLHISGMILAAFSAMTILASCDFLLPAPLGRDNPRDYGVQIGRFEATSTGATSLVTIWDWHNPQGSIPADQVIDKIRIVHSVNDPPSTMFPLNKDDAADIDSYSVWKFEWKGLSQGQDHYFTLYPHEKGGTWLAPRYTKFSMDYNISSQAVTLVTNSPITNPTDFDVTAITNPFSPSDETTNTGFAWNTGDFLVLRFNPSQTVSFTQFLLHLNNLGIPGSDMNLTMYPVKKDVGEITDWADMISSDTLDYGHAQTGQVLVSGGTNQSVDMAEAANRMFLYTPHSIAIIADGGLTIDISNWTIDSSYWGNQ